MRKKEKLSKKDLDTVEIVDVDKLPEELAVVEPTSDDLIPSRMQELAPLQQRVVHMYLGGGLTIQDIAQVLGYSLGYIRNILSLPKVKAAVEAIQLEEDEIIRQGIKALRMKAMQKMYTLMDSRQEAISYQAARDVLDRTGHKATVKQEVNVNVSFEQQLNEMLKEKNIDVIEINDYRVEDID